MTPLQSHSPTDTLISTMTAPTELKVYVTCVAVLYLKYLRVTMLQAKSTFSTGSRAPEDSNLPLARGKPKQTFGTFEADSKDEKLITDEKMVRAKETEARWNRILMNDLENLPMGIVVFGAGMLADGNTGVQIGAMVTFTAARCLHTVAYAKGLYPHRSICWLVGILSILVGTGNMLYGVYRS